ncbi:Fc.00g079250.m01.CDS01 [Cosmosporella sp. VM-42]
MAHGMKASILGLPDELLGPILLDAACFTPPSPFFEDGGFGTAAALPLVCRRFHRHATPYLFADIYIRCTGEDSFYVTSAGDTIRKVVRRTRLLHRTFRQNASLWPYCRKLTIDTGRFRQTPLASARESPMSNLLNIAVDFITWLTGTTRLWIYGQRLKASEVSHLLSLAVENLPGLKDLRLHDFYGARFVLPQVFEPLTGLDPSACLRTLDLKGISKIGNSLDWKRLRAKAGAASITELNLSNFVQSLEVLEALVRWPAKLEKFSFRLPSEYPYAGDYAPSRYSLGGLQPILAVHKATLTHIQIRELYSSGLERFSVADFPNLQSLYLSHDLTGTNITFVGNLVAPNLSKFHWDMTLEDQQCSETLGSFAQPEEDWLRAFCTAAIHHKSALRHVYIQFRPESYLYSSDREVVHKQYPWDRMDKIGREVQPHGITLLYNTPSVTRDEFQEMIGSSPDEY